MFWNQILIQHFHRSWNRLSKIGLLDISTTHSQEVISVLRSDRSPSKLSCDINNLLKRNLTFMYTVHILLTSDRTHAIGYMFHAISTKIRPIYKGEA